MNLKRTLAAVIALATVVAALAVWRTHTTSTAAEKPYSAQIRRTEYGIPHITAKDYGGLGYGYGYAFAQDNLCVLASWVVTLRGERSRYFGARAMSDDPIEPTRNFASDVYYKGLRQSGLIQRELDRPAPLGPTPQVRSMVDGYVAGYNRYLRDTGAAKLPDPSCRGKDWVRPITAMDIWTNVLDANRTESSTRFKEEIALAAPGSRMAAPPAPSQGAKGMTRTEPGTNAWALGGKATRSGHGMLLSDPHRPWTGISRFYQVQLTIPGVLNVSGAGLYGTPVIEIGHTAGVAWAHTTSHAQRYTLYKLSLVPGKPTSYLVDGKAEAMRTQKVKLTVQESGQRFSVTRTLYSSRYGPVLATDWTTKSAYAIADANAANLRSANEWLAMGTAQNLDQLRAAQNTYQGLPYVYTLATDTSGTAYFADASVVPHVTDAQAARCGSSGPADDSYVLDGSRSECAWGKDSDAIEPGIFGPGRNPTLTRTDYVANSNNTPWLTNPAAPLTGYPRIYGSGRTELKLRPRLGLDLIAQRLAGTDGLGPARFNLPTLQAAAITKRNRSAELGRADVVTACRAHPTLTAGNGRRIDVRQACDTLASWNGRADLDSRGAILWREVFGRLNIDNPDPDQKRWKVPFDPEQPLTTPRGLIAESAQRALADAVQFFQENHIPVTLTLGAAQHYGSVPLPGCTDDEGCFDRVDSSGDLGNDGRYGDVSDGSSFMMAVEMTPTGPQGRTLLTYSESADPTSPHHADQTVLFSRSQWVTERFTEAEINAAPNLRDTTVHN